MEDLKRLVRIIVQRKQRQYPLLDLKGDNGSKENVFFRYIKSGEVNADDEAAKLLYNSGGDDDRYRMLKSRLKQKLLNHLFFLDFSNKNKSTAEQMELECVQFLHQAKILQFAGEVKIARGILQKALTIADRCEYTNHQIHGLESLVAILSENSQPHLFMSTVDALKESRQVFSKEESARYDYLLMEMKILKSVNSRRNNLERVESTISKLYGEWKESKSYNIFSYYSKLKILFHRLTGTYEELLPFINEVEKGSYEGVKLNPYRINANKVILEKAHIYYKLKMFKDGKDYLNENAHFFDQKRLEWFWFMEVYYLMAIQSRDYQLAAIIQEDVFDSKLFESNDPDYINRWRIYGAYFQYAFSGNFYLAKVNYEDLLTEMPVYDKNKEPEQVAILILQILYFIEMKDIAAIKVRRDAVKKYISNHFKENFSYRTRTFYKLLNIIAENNLDIKVIQSKTRYLLRKLPEMQIVSDVYTEIEVIPYEHLWDLISNVLQNPRRMHS